MRDQRELIKWLRSEGFEVARGRRGNHYQIRRGKQLIHAMGGTPSDQRAIRNTVAALRRAGIDVPRG